MKRTSRINLQRMRKAPAEPKRLALVAAMAMAVSGCGDTRKATVYLDPEQCTDDNPELPQQCQAAYRQALEEARQSGPRYNSDWDCETEFGQSRCRTVEDDMDDDDRLFSPVMAAYLFSRGLDNRDFRSSALYTSTYRRSPLFRKWVTADGRILGDIDDDDFDVDDDIFKTKKKAKRTLSRGGFGSMAASKSRSSWGG